jgi:hypoxanthine phosphoribosyltransferase
MWHTFNEILIIVGALASVLAILFYIFGPMGPLKILIRRRASWRKVKKGVSNICTWFQAGEFDPDVILGVGRSGGIVACLVAGNLRLTPPRYIFGVIDRNFIRKEKGAIELEIYDNLKFDLTGKKIFLIDSELYTGRTMKQITDHLRQNRHVSAIMTAVLFKHYPSIFEPDFAAFTVKYPIEMSWEWTDAYRYTIKWSKGKLSPEDREYTN